ncbi:large ribosomal subunit protein bL35m [Neocloeon triangulifer]|uniref:large ribosomal subunit protein bL35m n=1 Tax=Neocloeon triangulifer TaxID=2078957 RepID=UPI00286EDBD0|nr:large ribosomal subunit protein bL35m [Neocloeon triangulifer]
MMIRSFVFQGLRKAGQLMASKTLTNPSRTVSILANQLQQNLTSNNTLSLSPSLCGTVPVKPLNLLSRIPTPVMFEQRRTLLNKYSLYTGRRVTNEEVVKRFFRLNWGMWIRVKAGREKRLWRKTGKNRKRLRYHVMCNATQCTLLDKMVTKFWRRERFLVNDPYAPYHKRENFVYTRKAPLDLPPPRQ